MMMKRMTGIALAALLLSGCQGLLQRGERPSQPPA